MTTSTISCANLDETNTVTRLIRVTPTQGVAWCTKNLKGVWVEVPQDSETGTLTAMIGSIYDPVTQTFTYPMENTPDGQDNL
jgi:hypothetical protein